MLVCTSIPYFTAGLIVIFFKYKNVINVNLSDFKFFQVLVKTRAAYFSVTPTGKLEELKKLIENIQALAPSAAPISPKAKDKCIVKLPKDNKW